MDVVLIKPGQKARLEVDSFKDQKFTGVVTDIADSSEGLNASSALTSSSSSSSGQSATQFQVRIRINEGEFFRPGMSVTADIETRTRTNVLCVPIASVTTRAPKTGTNAVAAGTNAVAAGASAGADGKKPNEPAKLVDVVFIVNHDHVNLAPVKIGISDDNYWEITDGLKEGDEIVSGGYHAISHDLEDGKKIIRDNTSGAAAKPAL
jgi:HlyD family secretion protein